MSNLCAKCLTRIEKGRMYCKDCDDSARSMFEELGYETFGKNSKYICYRNKASFIEFDLDGKCILTNKPSTTFNHITFKELQAINKQISELGWLDE